MIDSELIQVSTRVAVAPASAFTFFTEHVDAWWRRGSRFRMTDDADSVLRFDGQVGGRFVEIAGDGSELTFGRVMVWDPPSRLVFTLLGRDFRDDDRTEVEVRFEPDGDGTRVHVEHRGFDALPADHPARHGAQGGALRGLMGYWWADLLHAMKRYGEAHP